MIEANQPMDTFVALRRVNKDCLEPVYRYSEIQCHKMSPNIYKRFQCKVRKRQKGIEKFREHQGNQNSWKIYVLRKSD